MAKFDLLFDPPLMNAAGSLGFVPDSYGVVELERLGAFVTNPVSLGPRAPARTSGVEVFAGGFLMHTGYPNPGLKAVLRSHAGQWARSPVPVLVHLLCQSSDEVSQMVRSLEGQEGVMGVELGLPAEISLPVAAAWAQAASGELPVILRLPIERAGELARLLAGTSLKGQMRETLESVAISIGPPRGVLPSSKGNQVQGRLYGPALLPQAFAALQALVKAGVPAVAGCGVYRWSDADALLAAGALAVQLDAVLWRGGFFKSAA